MQFHDVTANALMILLYCNYCVLSPGLQVHACNRAAMQQRNPVVFVPGLGGSMIQGRRYSSRRPPAGCRSDTGRRWFNLWLNLGDFVRWPNCLAKDLSLEYRKSSGESNIRTFLFDYYVYEVFVYKYTCF